MKHFSAACFKYLILIFTALFILTGCSSEKERIENHLLTGKAYLQEGENEKARIKFMNAVKIDPKSIEGHKLLAKTYSKLGDKKATFTEYLRLEQLDPDNLEILNKTASVFLLQDNTRKLKDESIKSLKMTLTIFRHSIFTQGFWVKKENPVKI